MQRSTWLEWIIDRPWVIELFIGVFLLFFVHIFLKKIVLRSKKRTDLKESDWRFHLDYVIVAPTRVLLWVLLAAFVADMAIREFKLTGFAYMAPLRNAIIIVCLSWFLLRWKKVFRSVAMARRDMGKEGLRIDAFTVELVSKLFTVIVLFVTLLVMMSIFSLNIAPLVAFGSIGAAVLGIAGKDVIANFFGGFMIYLTRPFTIGDEIELQQKQMKGHVEGIGWYFTSLRDVEKRALYIPNALFSTEPLLNISRMTHRRIEETIGVRYDDLDKIPRIIEEVRALFESHPGIDHHLPLFVFLSKFADVGIHIEIKAYVLSTRYDAFMEIRQELLNEVYQIIQRAGAEIPYPAMEIRDFR